MSKREDYNAQGFTILNAQAKPIKYSLKLNFVCRNHFKKHTIEGEICGSQKSIQFECPECSTVLVVDNLILAKVIPIENKIAIADHDIGYIVRVK